VLVPQDKDRRARHDFFLIFIINGEDFKVISDENAPLQLAVAQALRESGNTGRPPEEWEVRDVNGVLLEQHRTPKELQLHKGSRLFLSLKVGAGGT
jgi:hypothetical protein